MDRLAAKGIIAAFPLLALAFYVGTRKLSPFWGYGMAMAFYWFAVLVPLIIWRGGFRKARCGVVLPSLPLMILNLLPIAVVAAVAILAFAQNPLPVGIIGAVLTAALINGTLEELFWRGTLLHNDATPGAQAGQLVLFTGWHVALLTASGIVLTGGPLALLGGAAAAGLLWTWARMQTGAIGFGILCHISLNIFAFTELAVKNYPKAF
jgi:membrane protease YdiL (CAAX protease family)